MGRDYANVESNCVNVGRDCATMESDCVNVGRECVVWGWYCCCFVCLCVGFEKVGVFLFRGVCLFVLNFVFVWAMSEEFWGVCVGVVCFRAWRVVGVGFGLGCLVVI